MAKFVTNAINFLSDGIKSLESLESLGVQLHVATEKMNYRAGELVTGKIWINSIVPIPMESVSVKISGWEITRVIQSKYINDDIHDTRNGVDIHESHTSSTNQTGRV